ASDTLRLQLLEPPDPSIPPGLPLPEADAATWVWRNQQPVIVANLFEAEQWPGYHEWAQRHGMNSLCVLPLTTARHRLGAICFAYNKPSAYTTGEVDFLRLVANQVAVAVDNAVNYETALASQHQLARERDRVRLLLEVNNAVVSHLDLDDLFPAVSVCLRRVIQHDGSALVLHDEETRRFRVHVLTFATNESFIEEGQFESDICEKSPCLIAITTRTPEVFDEEALQNLCSESSVARHLVAEGVKSFCSVALLSHDRALGTLNVGRHRQAPFGPEEVELLSEVAKQI